MRWKRNLLGMFLGVLVNLVCGAALAQSEEWVLGGEGGIDWGGIAQHRVQVDDESVPGAIQAVRGMPGRNIIETLVWDCRGTNACITSPTFFAVPPDDLAFYLDAVVDGDPATSTENLFNDPTRGPPIGHIIELDLGASFPVDSLVFYPRQEFGETFLRAFEVLANDGFANSDGFPIYTVVARVESNEDSRVSLKFAAQNIRFLRLRILTPIPFEIAELELYGADGFATPMIYETAALHREEVPAEAHIAWFSQALEIRDGEEVEIGADQAQASVTVRVKVGSDDSPLEDGQNWSVWSFPLALGEKIPVSDMAPYFALQIVVQSASVVQTVRLDSLVIGPGVAAPGDGECIVRPSDFTVDNRSSLDLIAAGGCFEMEGNFFIENSEFTSLAGLDVLRGVGGDLVIRDNRDLAVLDGLENLAYVEGNLVIEFNDALTSMQGLDQLDRLGGVRLFFNPLLQDLNGLRNLTAVEGAIEIIDHENLVDLSGLSNLTDIGGSLVFDRNPLLEDLSGLSNLTRVGSSLVFNRNPLLQDLSDLSKIRSIGQALSITDMPRLADLEGLDNLENLRELFLNFNPLLSDISALSRITRLEGSLSIWGNDLLTDLSPLNQITDLGGGLHIDSFIIEDLSDLGNIERIGGNLSITSSPLITDLDALSNLQSLGGLFLDNNAQLGDLGALSPIAAIEGGLTIRRNPLLGDLRGLHNIESIGEVLSIEANDLLEDLDDLDNLRKVEFGLNIINNRALENIDGLENIESIDDCLGCPVDISGNDVLKNIDGLKNINRIVGDLHISDNRALENVDGLEKLSEVLGRLFITNNPALTNLNGLHRLESVTSVDIVNNVSLPQRLAIAFFEGLSESEDGFSVFGQIFGNRPDPTMEFEIVPAEQEIQIQTRLMTADDGPSDLHLAPLILTAPIIEVPTGLVLSSIVWDADIPAGTHIQVRTRSGSVLFVEETLYFRSNGEQVTESQWGRLLSFQKGDIVVINRLEGDNWSEWSEWNRFSGEAFRSPPGQAVEVEVALSSQEPGVVPNLRSFTLTGKPPTAIVESYEAALPRVLALEQNYPNPFNSTTVLSIALPVAVDVELTVFNAAGQQVAVLAQGRRAAGVYTFQWDGRADDGRSLASGVYLYRLRAGDEVKVRRLLLLR